MKNRVVIQGAQTVQRAVSLLKLIATNEKHGVRLTGIAHEMQLEKPTVHRLLKALVAEGLLNKNEDTRCYSLGSLIYELGLAASNNFDFVDLCSPVLKTLALHTADTAFLFIRNEYDAVCIAREQGSYYIQTPVVSIGSRQPLGVSAGGLALLSALSEQEMEKVLDVTAIRLNIYGGLTVEETRQLYCDAHDKGYAVIANHAVSGVKGVGIPILNNQNIPIAAVTIASTMSRMSEEHIQETLPHLKKAAVEISELLADKAVML
jgi:DNA-binding IclR family transcriptional regulator